MIHPDLAALIKVYLGLLAWALGWLFAYCAVLLLPLGVWRYPALLAMTCVLVYDLRRDWSKEILP